MNNSGLSRLGKRTAAPPISWLMETALLRPGLISLAAGFTDNESLPLNEVRQLMSSLLRSRKRGREALQYGSTQGDARLCSLTSKRLRRLDGKNSGQAYSPERLIVTNGSQQLLYMVSEALFDPGDIVLVEDPTYFVYLGILQSRGIDSRGIRMGSDGIDAAHLDQVLSNLRKQGKLRRVKALYLVSYFQNPTGVTASLRRKREALEVLRTYESAAGHPIYLVEDAAYRELRFTSKDVPSLLGLRGAADRVIYAGTYSKPFATGVRVGFGILPEPLFTTVLRIKGNHDFGTSNLIQQLLADALESGKYDEHLDSLRRRYGTKANVMGRALKKEMPASVRWSQPDGGLYYWMRLPEEVDAGGESKIFKAAMANDVLYVPGELCYAEDPTRRKPTHEMRLSFGNASEEEIREGIKRLGLALKS